MRALRPVVLLLGHDGGGGPFHFKKGFLMPLINWQAPRAQLNSLIPSLSGIDRTIASDLESQLGSAGAAYSAAASTAMRDAYDATLATWSSGASVAFAQANRACAWAETQGGGRRGVDVAFSTDPAAGAALLARLDRAKSLPAAAAESSVLAIARSAIQYLLSQNPVGRDPYSGMTTTYLNRVTTLQALEAQIVGLVATANAFLSRSRLREHKPARNVER
jgi:signal transduction histidine kinase